VTDTRARRAPDPLTSGRERSRDRERRLRVAIALNVVIVVGQVVFGLVAGSLGLLSDAGHNLTDVSALVLSLIAIRIARRPPTSTRSFGWHRGTVLAAQANAAMILALTVWIGYEAVRRLIDPSPVEGGIVVIVALVGFAVNTAAALVVRGRHRGGDDDLNMRSALLHLVSDAAASLGVAAAGAVMLATGGWDRLDPAVSLVIALSIGWQAWRLLGSSNAVLLEGSPAGVDPARIAEVICGVSGVDAVHDVHVWSISSDLRALSAHVVVVGHPTLEEAQEVGGRVKAEVSERFRIAHATIELECETCEDVGPACEMDLVGEPTPSAPPRPH
jgi:cobalt-zinc-cadmium efflux system protein